MAEKVKSAKKPASKRATSTKRGLTFRHFFSTLGQDPMDSVSWERRHAVIRNASGQTVFEQHNVETPSFWSDMALNVVSSRYFRGKPGSTERETSVRALTLRIVNAITAWGSEQGYFKSDEDAQAFRAELMYLILHQMASFNSPVWFNVGIDEKPQCSACFILSVEDTMEAILDWYKQEGLIFKSGSGAGVNLSRLRSGREPLGGGGTASGPVSFMRAADASAGVIKSGGKTRRAAKMVILDVDHPDIVNSCGVRQLKKKAQALMLAGFRDTLESRSSSIIGFQNSNHSVRVTDAFMDADRNDEEWRTRFVLSHGTADTFRARDLMHEMALAAHACGDPGIQFHTTINRWHTCPHIGNQGIQPLLEYMHVDDSACNLASLRLTAFLDERNVFRVDAFRQAIDVLITAQDILVNKASYPTPAITRNSGNLRALGLGFADLGALIMRMGLAYDSDDARSMAASLTSLMSAEAYAQSARIAEQLGAFAEFAKNRESMLGVIGMHLDATERIVTGGVSDELSKQAKQTWKAALALGKRVGYRNCQVTVLAPTGTVAFMMDCDTTGIEPELALVKYKSLVDGGQLKMVNGSVPTALKSLGYSPEVIDEVLAKLEAGIAAEDIEELHASHLPVFDCSFKPIGGERYISPAGHLLMMAAVQPFISGAISKTVNLPADTTVEHIEEIFRDAWRLGLKSITVYRDGCKTLQPLALSPGEAEKGPLPVRRRLPVDCKSVRHKFEIAGQKGYIHTGFYEDGRVGEIFIAMSKEGSTISGLMDTIATLTSIALQYGVPLEALVNKFSHVRFEPSGFTSNPEIPIAKSLTDYIFRFLGIRFLTKEQQETAGLIPVSDSHEALFQHTESHPASPLSLPFRAPHGQSHAFRPQSDAPSCFDCGAIMVRSGSCYKCLNCGATSGCS